ncbi:ABC transporter substrate-binding protein [Rhodoplanes sp. Z2-YC6860]|uniref:ABC transporter substrate-binding protein n=1 Tax=Rhodoplanes sp. Z2-YC6860 TaxID=674703 RepID=UPI00078B6AF7|nr:ABC transporter substrate-binding protein [Rhodoplanes sp. Z2-YC6860]AMN41311.1 ABC transporter substrate binding protein [Rhodoplanes sp. Z2-YC6860]
MRRREFVAAVVGATAIRPATVFGQPRDRIWRIGILLVGGLEPLGPFREALGELGYLEGKNIRIDIRSGQGQDERLPSLASDLVRDGVDVMIAVQTPAAHAAKNATRTVPIVVMAGDPIGTGLIRSLARPEGNITGMSVTAAEAVAKSLELIPEIIPEARRVGVLGNADDLFMKPFFDQIQQGASGLGLEVREVVIRSNDDLDSAFETLIRDGAKAVIVQGSLPVKKTVDLALKHRLPSLSTQKSAVQAGLLMSYSASFSERARVLARYVDQIFKGAKPADLPVQQPSKYELVINMKTAKTIGLTVSPMVLARADEVLE